MHQEFVQRLRVPPYSLTGDQPGLTGSGGGAESENSWLAYRRSSPHNCNTIRDACSSSGMENVAEENRQVAAGQGKGSFFAVFG